jgi:hypothetical protein
MALRARISALMFVMEAQHNGSISNSNIVIRAELKRIMDKVRVEVLERHPENGNFSTPI